MMPYLGGTVQSAGQPQVDQNAGPRRMPMRGPVGMPTRFNGPQGGQPPVASPMRFNPGGSGPSAGVPRPTPGGPVLAGPTPGGPLMGSFKKGGKVPKTGNYKLHAGERVLTKKQAKLAPVALLLRAKKG
jgi:hypothetical protein